MSDKPIEGTVIRPAPDMDRIKNLAAAEIAACTMVGGSAFISGVNEYGKAAVCAVSEVDVAKLNLAGVTFDKSTTEVASPVVQGLKKLVTDLIKI